MRIRIDFPKERVVTNKAVDLSCISKVDVYRHDSGRLIAVNIISDCTSILPLSVDLNE